MRRNPSFSNSSISNNKYLMFASHIVIIHCRLTIDYIHAGLSLAALRARSIDSAKKVGFDFCRA